MSVSPHRELELEESWELPPEPADWDEVVREARLRGCTVADVLYDRPTAEAA